MQLLRYPVNYIGIVTNYSSDHQALDLAWHNKEHEDIMACADGKVINIWQDEDFGGGLSLKIQYDNGYASDFKHLSETLVKVGQTVKQGEVVAKMGNSGWACKGTHLHYNCYKNGARVNPATETYVFDGQEVCKDDKDKVLYYNADLPEIDTWLVINDEAGLYLLDSNKKKIGLYNYGTDVIFKGAGYTYKNNEYYYIQINGDKKLGYMAKQYLSEKYPTRGDIIDIFSVNYDKPIRIEFFDDEIESIRFFEISTQISTKTLQKVDILPANDIILTDDEIKNAGDKIYDILENDQKHLDYGTFELLRDSTVTDIDKILQGHYDEKIYKYFGRAA